MTPPTSERSPPLEHEALEGVEGLGVAEGVLSAHVLGGRNMGRRPHC
jgi:hypothetical protein